MIVWLVLTAFVFLLLLAALEDVRSRRIPNAVTAGIAALFVPYALLSPAPPALIDALALALAAFLIGWLLFARGWMGGGDVKLIAAVALWAGSELILPFLLVTSLAGGALALFVLLRDRWAPMATLALGSLGLLRLAPPGPPDALPYGLAIAAGGLLVAFELAARGGV